MKLEINFDNGGEKQDGAEKKTRSVPQDLSLSWQASNILSIGPSAPILVHERSDIHTYSVLGHFSAEDRSCSCLQSFAGSLSFFGS